MEDQIDLRRYLRALVPYGKWIAAAAIVLSIAAFAISLVLPKVYEATALVIVSTPRYQLIENALGEVSDVQIASSLYPELALSGDVVAGLREALPSGALPLSDQELREMLTATAGKDPTLVKLTVTGDDPAAAAAIANAWAEVFVKRAGGLIGTSTSQVAFLEAQLAQAEQELGSVAQELLAFRALDTRSLLQGRITAYTRQHAAYLQAQQDIAGLVLDAQGLRSLVSGQAPGSPLSEPDALAALLLQIRAFQAGASEPLQLQIDGTTLRGDMTAGELLSSLDRLISVLNAKSQEVEARLLTLEPLILTLQTDLQRLETEAERLDRAQEVAEAKQQLLATQLEETRVAAANTSRDVQLASLAAAPEEPSEPSILMNTVVAGIAAAFCGVLVASLLIWWRGEPAKD